MTRWLFVVALAFAAGCRSPDPAFYNADGERLKRIAPLPYRIALAPVESQGTLTGERPEGKDKSPYWFTFTDEAVQKALRDSMRRERACVEIVLLGASGRDAVTAAQSINADLLVRPILSESPDFARAGTHRVTATTLLWWFTWIGGALIADKRYQTDIAFDFELVNPSEGTTIATYRGVSYDMDLTLWERNGSNAKGGTLYQSLILPPYWTVDNKERTSRVLTERVCRRLGARLTGFLKQDFLANERANLGSLKIVGARVGDDVGPELDLRLRIDAEQPFTDCAVYLNESADPIYELVAGSTLPPAAQQAAGNHYRILVEPEAAIPMQDGRNVVQVEFAIHGRYSSRTLEFWNGNPKGDEKKHWYFGDETFGEPEREPKEGPKPKQEPTAQTEPG